MTSPKQQYYDKRAEVLIKNLKSRHFGACYCATREEALEKGAWEAVGRSTDAGVDVFITGANALSMDGQMVNIDGYGNRCAAIIYGPKSVIVIAGMNKVTDDLDSAIIRARTVAAPMNQQRFLKDVPCSLNGVCSDCKSADCICNQVLITRHGRAGGRIKFIIVGENLGL